MSVEVLDGGTVVEVIEEQYLVEVTFPGPQGPRGLTGATGPTGPAGAVVFDGGAPDTVFAGTGLIFDGGGVS
jgi:hypothetical protein